MRERPKISCTARAFAKEIDDYFASCAADERLPTVAGLCLRLRLSPSEFITVVRAFDSDAEPRGFTRAHARELLMAQLRICDIVEQSRDSMSIFKLKQPLYSGCLDGAGDDAEISVSLTGADADAWE